LSPDGHAWQFARTYSRIAPGRCGRTIWANRSGRDLGAAVAGGPHRHLAAGQRQVEALLHQRALDSLAAAGEAFVQAVQRPNIVGVLARPAELSVIAEIRAVDRLGLLDPALLEQQCAQRVARRLHPAPGLVIGERVVQLDRAAEMVERLLDVALAVLKLAQRHLLGDR